MSSVELVGQPRNETAPTLSVVVPVYNEEDCIEEMINRLETALSDLKTSYEIIICNDGSQDRSAVFLDSAAEANPHIKALHFRRNFGQTAALDAGFKHARGEFVVPIDADLQNDPSDIPMLLEKAREGYDVVKGWRQNRKDPFLTRVLPSKVANWIIGKITGVKLHDYGCTLTLYRREVLEEINLYGEMHRFIPVYAHAVGANIVEVPVQHHPRKFGESKYGLGRTFRVLFDLMTVSLILGYNTKPLYFFGKFGLSSMMLGGGAWAWTLIKKVIWGQPLFTDPFFSIGTFFMLAGIQILLFGLLAEITVRTYFESQQKHSWILRPPKTRTNEAQRRSQDQEEEPQG